MAAAPHDSITVRTAENVSLGYATAGVGSRMVAQLLDNLLAIALMVIALLVGVAVASSASTQEGFLYGTLAGAGIALFVYFMYFLVSEAVSGGRTLGKLAMGLRVLRVDGGAPDLVAIIVRNVVRILDVIFGIGLVVMFFHPLSRRLGDLAAGTVVVRDASRVTLAAAAAPPPVFLRTPDAGPAIDGIDHLGEHERSALRTFLGRPGLQPQTRAQLAAQLSSRLYERLHLPLTAPERMWPPELFLERLYLQLDARLR